MKYNISNDFKYIRFLTFPVVKAFAPIAHTVLGALIKINHSDSSVSAEKCCIKTDGAEIKTLVYRPKNCKDKMPALVYYHGGGFIYNAAPYHYRLAKLYCKQASCIVIMPDYRLTPKNKYPVPFNDCYHTLEWTVQNADRLGIDINKIAVAGDSAGGNLAAAVVLAARDRKLVNLCGQMLVYPVTDRRMQTVSMKKYTDTPIWNAVLSKKMWQFYLGDGEIRNIKYASPAESENLSGLPETYVETAEFDCLHDEGINYAQAMKKAGVNVKINETDGTIHGFDMASKSKIVLSSIKKRTEFLKEVFK